MFGEDVGEVVNVDAVAVSFVTGDAFGDFYQKTWILTKKETKKITSSIKKSEKDTRKNIKNSMTKRQAKKRQNETSGALVIHHSRCESIFGFISLGGGSVGHDVVAFGAHRVDIGGCSEWFRASGRLVGLVSSFAAQNEVDIALLAGFGPFFGLFDLLFHCFGAVVGIREGSIQIERGKG